MSKYAFITLCTNDKYFSYLLALVESFKKTNSKYPLYCLITSDVSQEILKYMEIIDLKTIMINTEDLNIFIKKQENIKYKNFIKALPKLKIFTLTQFDKCVYLDADMLIQHNIDDLFNYPIWSAVEDQWQQKEANKYSYGCSLFNSGLFVFAPSIDFYNKIINDINRNVFKENVMWHDQSIFAYYNQKWLKYDDLHLSIKYNLLIKSDNLNKIGVNSITKANNFNILHFIVKDMNSYNKADDTILKKLMFNYFSYINKLIDDYNFDKNLKIGNF